MPTLAPLLALLVHFLALLVHLALVGVFVWLFVGRTDPAVAPQSRGDAQGGQNPQLQRQPHDDDAGDDEYLHGDFPQS
jgi:hypothetical protein